MAYWEGSYEGAREIYSKLPPNARTLKRRFKAAVSAWRAKG